ncbi:sugar ABC transporter ATP-binding protein [Mixta sp. Marseille-Q2057]|nr:sugar ABC transporter ATP-binding protein [Mixta mediterraneensis]
MKTRSATESLVLKLIYSTKPILIDGKVYAIKGPKEALAAGITLIYQEINLAPNLTVAENIFLGSEISQGGMVKRRQMADEAQQVINRLGAQFSANDRVSRLSIAEQQVEIARALHRNSRILVMDEPTAALSNRETEQLFALIKRLRSEGMAIIYISHRMAEVYELSDRVSVLRDGQYVGSLTRDQLNASELVRMMVGRPLSDLFNKDRTIPFGDIRLAVNHLSDGGKVRPGSLAVRAGEIVGLAGLVGAGRSELAQLIFGVHPPKEGEIWVDGEKVSVHSPRDAIARGIGFLTENRKEQGLFLEMAAQENIVMATLERDASYGLLNRRKGQQIASNDIENLNIRVPNAQVRAGGLSGGNQQKLLISRWVAIGPRILILDEPTRGVDVGAKSEIYRMMQQMARQGVAILMISSELPEVVGMSDRVYVMREGAIAGELEGEEISQENIMTLATGAHSASPLEV